MAYTPHVSGMAGSWMPVVKCDGVEVWRGASVGNRDHDTNSGPSARSLARLVVTAIEKPEEIRKRRDWLGAHGHKYGDRNATTIRMYEWAVRVAADIGVKHAESISAIPAPAISADTRPDGPFKSGAGYGGEQM